MPRLSYKLDESLHYRDQRPLWCGVVLVGATLTAVLLTLGLLIRAVMGLLF